MRCTIVYLHNSVAPQSVVKPYWRAARRGQRAVTRVRFHSFWHPAPGLRRSTFSVFDFVRSCDFSKIVRFSRFTFHVYYYYATTRLNESHISGTPP